MNTHITRIMLAVVMSVCALMSAFAQQSQTTRPEIAVIYYPHWHPYDHGSAWKGEGWTEWEFVKTAVPRFPGHVQPLKPTWGYFDESDPAWTAKEIDLAADNGIDVFVYDWYWYSGVQNMQEALENGFLKAPNRSRLKFALMWANHDRRDQFRPEHGQPRNVWLRSFHSEKDLLRMIDYCIEHYFREPNYWRVNGGSLQHLPNARIRAADGWSREDVRRVPKGRRAPPRRRPAADALERDGRLACAIRRRERSRIPQHMPLQRSLSPQGPRGRHRGLR